MTVSLSFIADCLSPRNRAACFGLIMACFRCVCRATMGWLCVMAGNAAATLPLPLLPTARCTWVAVLRLLSCCLLPPDRAVAELCFFLCLGIFLRSVAIFIGPPVGAMLAPLTAALGALGTVAGCALYTLLLLPESLTPEAKAAVRAGGGCGESAVRLLDHASRQHSTTLRQH